MPSNTCLDGFDFRDDGFFFDADGSACVLIGTVEFNHFWNAFDACFPLLWVENLSTQPPMQRNSLGHDPTCQIRSMVWPSAC